jgi:hypothetical protein
MEIILLVLILKFVSISLFSMKGEPAEDISFLGNTFTPHRIATLHSYGRFDGAATHSEMVIDTANLLAAF